MKTLDPEKPRRRRPLWRRTMIGAQLLVGLGVGAVIAELVFSQRDAGAFPHANFYRHDPELGVRLEPGASMRFALRNNPLTTIHVNEGGLHDLVLASRSAHAEVASVQHQAFADLERSQERLGKIFAELDDKRDDLDKFLAHGTEFLANHRQHRIARGQPGDIITAEHIEASREVRITAAMIRKAARERDLRLAAALREEAQTGEHRIHDLVKAEAELLAERRALREKIAAGIPPVAPPPSIFRAYLQDFKALCDQHGAELVVVALPIDVQVDPQEWAKYGVTDAPDMQESLVLLGDLIADARRLGLRALDATTALRAAEPGAFLDHDIHMTAKGHAALAEALAATLAAPVLPVLHDPAPGLPKGRSFVPTADEWSVTDGGSVCV